MAGRSKVRWRYKGYGKAENAGLSLYVEFPINRFGFSSNFLINQHSRVTRDTLIDITLHDPKAVVVCYE